MLQDFQFYNVTRLQEIFDKEQNFELFKHTQAQKEQAARAQVGPPALLCPPWQLYNPPGHAFCLLELHAVAQEAV